MSIVIKKLIQFIIEIHIIFKNTQSYMKHVIFNRAKKYYLVQNSDIDSSEIITHIKP